MGGSWQTRSLGGNDPPGEEHISASFGERTPAYANWFHIQLGYITRQGHLVWTAGWGVGLFFSPKQQKTMPPEEQIRIAIERREEVGQQKIGKRVGFGKYENEYVANYRVESPTFRPHPDGIEIEIKEDANLLLIKHLSKHRSPQATYSRDERQSIDWMREMAGERFAVMHDEDIPQMCREQFWNTMPHKQAPAGFYLPRGLCNVVIVEGVE